MTSLEGWQNSERQSIGPGSQREAAGLSRSVQGLYHPIDRQNAPARQVEMLDFGTGADLYRSAGYTGERLSASAVMADQNEQKLDAPKSQSPSDAIIEAGAIFGHVNQARAVKPEIASSGTMPALNDSFRIDGNLTAADVGYKRKPDAVVAWDPQKWARDTTNAAQDAVSEAKKTTEKAAEHAWYPFRGKEDSQVDYTACATAFRAFPEFADHQNIDRALIPALIRNELHFYNLKENPLEATVKTFGDLPDSSISIGPAQIKKSNIERLMQNFPQLSDPELGGITENPLKAALDPAKAPWFVAAYLAEKIQARDSAKLPVTHQALIQDYNPGGRVHFNHVHEQLLWIKTHHAGW